MGSPRTGANCVRPPLESAASRHTTPSKQQEPLKRPRLKYLPRVQRFLSPVFIVGFHHSGTRLIAKLLRDLGVFQVVNRTTFEWGEVQDLNEKICPKWHDPDAVRQIELRSAVSISRWRIGRLLWERGYRGSQVWGHKDPRTCVTLPVWLRAFPDASIVHIVRDPLDVLGTLGPNYSPFTRGSVLPQEDLPGWGELWKAYIDAVENSGSNARTFVNVRFEDLCSEPKAEMNRIAAALDLTCSLHDVEEERVRSDKTGIHKQWISAGKLDSRSVSELESQLRDYRRRYRYS